MKIFLKPFVLMNINFLTAVNKLLINFPIKQSHLPVFLNLTLILLAKYWVPFSLDFSSSNAFPKSCIYISFDKSFLYI